MWPPLPPLLLLLLLGPLHTAVAAAAAIAAAAGPTCQLLPARSLTPLCPLPAPPCRQIFRRWREARVKHGPEVDAVFLAKLKKPLSAKMQEWTCAPDMET